MSGVRINVVVEGHAEEGFVRSVMAPYLGYKNVFVTARRVYTSRDRRTGRYFRGGMDDYEKPRRDIVQWLKQEQQAHVTTMFDLFRLPAGFPGIETVPQSLSGGEKAAYLQAAMAADLDDPRFIPYIQPYEFEALLFSDVSVLDEAVSLNHPASIRTDLEAILAECGSPENINDGPSTAPSKRLLALVPSYSKTLHGELVTARIGLDKIRAHCPHFDAWISNLESLSSSP